MCERNNVDTAHVFSHVEGAISVFDNLTRRQTHIVELPKPCSGCSEKCYGFIHWKAENRWSGLSKEDLDSYEDQIAPQRQERDHLSGSPF